MNIVSSDESGVIDSDHAPARSRPTIPMGRDPVSTQSEARQDEQLAGLFARDTATDYRARWTVVQQGFVDDPRKAVEQGDELVRAVLSDLEATFSQERSALDNRLGAADQTETLRLALRRYRSFFDRVLSL